MENGPRISSILPTPFNLCGSNMVIPFHTVHIYFAKQNDAEAA